MNLVGVVSLIQSWRVHWQDGAVGMITFVATLVWALNLEVGIGLGGAFACIESLQDLCGQMWFF